MAGIDMRDLLRLMGKQLHPLDVENLKYIFEDSFTGKFHKRLILLTLQLSEYERLFHGKMVGWATSLDISEN